MNGRDVASLACKLMGLFIAANAVIKMPAAIYAIIISVGEASGADSEALSRVAAWSVATLITLVIQVGVGATLWTKSGHVAGLMAGRGQQGGTRSRYTTKQASVAAFLVLGVYTIASALPGLVSLGMPSASFVGDEPVEVSVYATLVRLLVGGTMVLWARNQATKLAASVPDDDEAVSKEPGTAVAQSEELLWNPIEKS